MKLVEVSSRYVDYMKQFFSTTILDNKQGNNIHNRKYLGIVFSINDFNYFVPLSSPKKSDYEDNGNIKKSTKLVLRMVKIIENKTILIGTLKLNNMMPIPNSEIIPYGLNNETDLKYKKLIIKELDWIQQNTSKIYKSASYLYSLRTKINMNNNINSKFLNSIMPFKEAEQKCKEFTIEYSRKIA